MEHLAENSFFLLLNHYVSQKFPHHFPEESLLLLSSDIKILKVEHLAGNFISFLFNHYVSQKFPHHFLEESLPLLSSDIQWHKNS